MLKRALITVAEHSLRRTTQLRGIGIHPDPMRHFGPGGLEEAERLCAAANRDFEGFLRPPERQPAQNLARTILPHRRFEIEELRFDSPRPSGVAVNDRVQARVYRRKGDTADRAILFHHPIYQRYWHSWEWFLTPLIERMPVAVMAAPWHYGRIPQGEFPGQRTCGPNPWTLFLSLRQWMADEAVFRDTIEYHCGVRPVALTGFSLGAFQSLLGSSLGFIPEMPLVSICTTNRYAHGIIEGFIGNGIFAAMQRAGIDADKLRKMTESIELERWVDRLKGRRVLYIHGLYDPVDPPPSPERLQQVLQPTRKAILASGHGTVVLERGKVMREMIEFLTGDVL